MAATKWECSGVECYKEEGEGKILMVWECQKCGYKIYGGVDTPAYDCPKCGEASKI